MLVEIYSTHPWGGWANFSWRLLAIPPSWKSARLLGRAISALNKMNYSQNSTQYPLRTPPWALAFQAALLASILINRCCLICQTSIGAIYTILMKLHRSNSRQKKLPKVAELHSTASMHLMYIFSELSFILISSHNEATCRTQNLSYTFDFIFMWCIGHCTELKLLVLRISSLENFSLTKMDWVVGIYLACSQPIWGSFGISTNLQAVHISICPQQDTAPWQMSAVK